MGLPNSLCESPRLVFETDSSVSNPRGSPESWGSSPSPSQSHESRRSSPSHGSCGSSPSPSYESQRSSPSPSPSHESLTKFKRKKKILYIICQGSELGHLKLINRFTSLRFKKIGGEGNLYFIFYIFCFLLSFISKVK